MKIKILSVIAVAGLATCAFGQDLTLDNGGNSGALNASNNGLVYENGTLFNGLLYNLGVTVLGGPNSGSLSAMGTFTPITDPKGYTGLDEGQFSLGSAGVEVAVPGVSAGGPATIELQIWDYDSPGANATYSSYAAALAGGDYTATVTFVNAVSDPNAAPPISGPNFSGMPSVNLLIASVPEPTTIALAGLGIASLLAFRRRK